MNETQNELFKKLIDVIPACIDAMDADGNIVFWNEECEKVTGYRAEEIVGNPKWMELLYPDAAYRGTLINQWVKKGNNFRNWEIRLQAKDGSIKVISWSNLSDIFTIPGWDTWAIGFDVTAYIEKQKHLLLKEKHLQTLFQIRKDMQKAHSSEQIANTVLNRLEELFRSQGGIILLYDFDQNRAEIVSAKFEQALFYHAENYIPLDKLLHISEVKQGELLLLEDLNVYAERVKLASLLIKKMGMKTALLVPLMHENVTIGSLSLYSKNTFQIEPEDKEFLFHVGRLLAFSLHQSRLIERFQNKIIDLEQKTIGQVAELKRNERRLRAQYESIPIPTYTWQKSGDDFVLIDYNDMALAATYGKIGGLLGHKASEIYKSLPELVNLLQECYENEITIETQIKATSASQEPPSYLSLKLAYVAPDSVLMHIEDITEEFQAQQTIERLQELNQKQNKVIELLQNDLSTISVLLFPLLQEYLSKLNINRNEMAAKLPKEKGTLLSLTDDLVQYHHDLDAVLNFLQRYLSIHTRKVKAETFDLANLIQSLMDEHASILKDISIRIYLETQEAFTDANILKDILDLLLQFIVKHVPSDRNPILRIISAPDEQNNTVITLRDNGLGLPESLLGRMRNDKFDQKDSMAADQDFLTLLLVKRMVKLLSGEMHIESQKDEGTTFRIILPGETVV